MRHDLAFAYGSNLNAAHCAAEGCPPGGLTFVTRALLPDRRLAFLRERRDGTAALDVVPARGFVADGAVYAVRDEDTWRWLDRKEGVGTGAYRCVDVVVQDLQDRPLAAMTYEVVTRVPGLLPSSEYAARVAAGRRSVGIDDDGAFAAWCTMRDTGIGRVSSLFVASAHDDDALESLEAHAARAAVVDVVPAVHHTNGDPVAGDCLTLADDAVDATLAALDDQAAAAHRVRRLVHVTTSTGPRRAWTYPPRDAAARSTR